MHWQEFSIKTTQEAVEAVSHFLYEMGSGGVAVEESSSKPRKESLYGEIFDWNNTLLEEEVIIQAYFPALDVSQEEERANTIHQFIQNLGSCGIDAGHVKISIQYIAEEDWAFAWKQYFKPIRVSSKLIIKPTWENDLSDLVSDNEKPNIQVIEIDPGMAFGTGTHASTILSLQLLERYLKSAEFNHSHVIDVGTGSGILAIAAAKLGAEKILAIDLDPVAVASARDNVRINQVENQVTVCQGDLLTFNKNVPIILPVQLIVANILAEIIVTFCKDAAQALCMGGIFITSGIIESKAELVARSLMDNGFVIEERISQEDWVAFAARKS